jgi:CysZ protein
VELCSVAMQRRGIPVRERLRILRTRKALAVGFGAPLVAMFLVPLVAVFLMPGAVAGAALLVRHLMGEDQDGDGDREDREDREDEAAPAPGISVVKPDGEWSRGGSPQ